jgi:PadR family transcriptional regulator, regulatory protein PadR
MASRDYLGTFEMTVMLCVIRLGENAYGVPIVKEIKEATRREPAVGSVYAALERLETKRLVISERGETTSERGGKAKRYFRVTAEGMREIREARKTLTSLWKALPEQKRGQA